MNVHRTVRYRMHPGSSRKHQLLHGTAGACRFVWNHMVGKLKDEYGVRDQTGLAILLYWQGVYDVAEAQLQVATGVFQRIPSKVSLQPIETAYREFFKDIKAGGKLGRKPPEVSRQVHDHTLLPD